MTRLRAADLARLVREKLVRPLLPHGVTAGLNRNDRIGAFHRAWGHVFTNHLRGAYYEFGVYFGEGFRASHQVHTFFTRWLQRQLGADEPWRRDVAKQYADFTPHFYAFDTFQGMPEHAEDNDVLGPGHFRCSLEEFARLNRKAGLIEGPAVRYFVGTFQQILRRDADVLAGLQPAAVVNIDCDLYASARDALEIVGSKLMQGSVLLVDDWNIFAADPEKGERRALREFLASHPAFSFEPWFSYEYAGQAFLVHRNGIAGDAISPDVH